MTKKIALFLYKFLLLSDSFFFFLTKKRYLFWLKDFFHEDSYTKIKVLDKDVNFFVPNSVTNNRVDTFYTKEPETLAWIDDFLEDKNIIFWDIGSNIGQYSIYAALKHEKCHVVSFEPSTSNLRVLSRNVSINGLEERIDIFTMPLIDKGHNFLMMNEKNFEEGRAQNSFGDELDHLGNKFSPKSKYQLLGISINQLLDTNVLEIPDYIKIDVDGIELLILQGSEKYLKNQKIKSISIELNEGREEEFKQTLELMEESGFKIKSKKRDDNAYKDHSKFINQYNYVFGRENI